MARQKTSPATLPFRVIKMMGIGYITTLYFIAGFAVAIMTDHWFYQESTMSSLEHRSNIVIILEIIGLLWLNGCFFYIVRNLIEYIPYPLDGMFGYVHDRRVLELRQASIFMLVILFFQNSLKVRMNHIYFVITQKKVVI